MAFMSLEHPDSVLALAAVRARGSDSQFIASGCQDHAVRLYDATSFACVKVLTGHARAVLSLTFCQGLLFSGSSDTTVRVWDLRPRSEAGSSGSGPARRGPTFECLAVLRLGMGSIYSLASWAAPQEASSSDGTSKISIFAGCQDSNVYRLDLEVGGAVGAPSPAVSLRGVAGFTGHQGFVYSCMVREAASGVQVLAGSGDGRLRVWEAVPVAAAAAGEAPTPSATPTPVVGCGGTAMSACAVTGSDAISSSSGGSADGACLVLAVPSPEPAALYRPTAVLVSPSPADVLRTRQASVIADVSPTPHAAVTVYPGSEGSGDGSSSGSSFGTGATARPEATGGGGAGLLPSSDGKPGLPGGCGGVYALAAHGRDVYTGSADGCVRVWDADSLVLKYVLTGHEGEVLSLAVSGGEGGGGHPHPSASSLHLSLAPPSAAPVLASGSADGSIRLWSTKTYSCVQVLRPAPRSSSTADGADEPASSPAPPGMILALASSGSTLFSASNDNTIRVYDTAARGADGGDLAHHHHHHHNMQQQQQHQLYASNRTGRVSDAYAGGDAVSRDSSGQVPQLARLRPQLPPHLSPGPTPPPAPGFGAAAAATATPSHTRAGAAAAAASAAAARHYHYQLPPAGPVGAAMDFSPSHTTAQLPGLAGFGGHQSAPDAATAVGRGAGPGPAPPASPGFDLSQQSLLSVLRALISIPSVSIDDPPRTRRDVEACWRAARYINDLLCDLGAECRLVQGSPGSNPLVLARLGGWDPDTPAICLHAHYDVQPAGDESKWSSPPFTLTGRDGFLYARGATDYKGPLVAMIFAVARYWAAANADNSASSCRSGTAPRPPAFVFIVEGEGENGSVGFREAILQNVEWFSGTRLVLNCNNTWIGEVAPCLTYGMRGLVKLRVDVEGPSSDLHSGLDGGVAQEPLQELCGLMASLSDSTSGRIVVPGLYDSVAPLTPAELDLYKGLDFDVGAYMDTRGLPGIFSTTAVATATTAMKGADEDTAATSELPAKRPRLAPGAASTTPAPLDVTTAVLLRRWREPSVTVHGVVCSASNDSIIPRKATGFVSVRTVPHMTSAGTFEAVAAHLRSVFLARRSANRLTVSMTSHAAWWWGNPAAPHFQAAARAIEEHWGRPPIFVREGGTVRVTTFLERTLSAPALHFPMGQSSDAPHLPNERIRLLNLVMGAKVLQSYFGLLAAQFAAEQGSTQQLEVVVRGGAAAATA